MTFNAVCSVLHPPDLDTIPPVVLTAKSQEFSTKSNALHNPKGKSCRAFFQPSLFNTSRITPRKFLMLKCEHHLAPAWFHLPGMTLGAASMDQQVTACPQQSGCALLVAVTSCRQRGMGKGHSLSTPRLKGHLKRQQKDPSPLLTHFHIPTLGHMHKSVMPFIKTRQINPPTATRTQ